MKRRSRREIAARAAADLWDGACVNLGIGIPTEIPDHVSNEVEILFHSENGLLGMGPAALPGQEDADLINAGKRHITMLPGGSFFSHNDAFVMIRGGHVDLSIMGAFEVSAEGDLANWATNDPHAVPGVGGAMDLAIAAREVWVLMEHTTKDGVSRIRTSCSYPLTARNCVSKVYTDLAILRVTRSGLVVEELVPGLDLRELQSLTDAPLRMAEVAVGMSSWQPTGR